MILLWKCIGGLQYISSHPLVVRVIVCLVKGFFLLYLLPYRCGIERGCIVPTWFKTTVHYEWILTRDTDPPWKKVVYH
jgi:hypothetical protein